MTKGMSEVLDAISVASTAAGREADSVRVLGAIKKATLERVNAFTRIVNERGSVALLGESYVQEMLSRAEGYEGDFEIHFIGRVQSNKVATLVDSCAVIQSVGRQKILDYIIKEIGNHQTKMTQRIFLQVNVSEDPRKDGFAVNDLGKVISSLKDEKAISLEGLMTITENYGDSDLVRKDYARLSEVARQYQLAEISMGMSGDFRIAIEEGSTMVRLGTMLFGSRS